MPTLTIDNSKIEVPEGTSCISRITHAISIHTGLDPPGPVDGGDLQCLILIVLKSCRSPLLQSVRWRLSQSSSVRWWKRFGQTTPSASKTLSAAPG